MAATIIQTERLDARAFSSFGAVVAAGGSPLVINNGYAKKHPALAEIEAAPDGKSRIHLFAPKARIPPIPITMMERHPKGAQCFVPLGGAGWLALVAGNDAGGGGKPSGFRAFAVPGDAGLCYGRGVWHFPLLALTGQHFAVADGGDTDDLEEYFFDDIRWLVHNHNGDNGGGGKDTTLPAGATSEDAFMKRYGSIAEESPWVAKAVWQNLNDGDDSDNLATAFAFAILRADDDLQLQLIRKHPPLATTKPLSGNSATEQQKAGLANLPADDAKAFAKLNDDYAARFGFPFVCAVAGLSAAGILGELQRRADNNAPNAEVCERGEALYNICQIIRHRLRGMRQ